MYDPSRGANKKSALVPNKKLVLALTATASLAFAWVTLAALPARAPNGSAGTGAAAWRPSEVVRLHVIAASDRPADQQAKLRAARAVLAELDRLGREAPAWARQDGKGFLRWVAANRPAIERVAAEAAGMGPVRLEAGRFFFPLTVDPNGTLYPAGWYTGVRVVIGQGRGRNWWCVVFPSLCPAPRPDDEQAARAASPADPPSAVHRAPAPPAPEPQLASPGATGGASGGDKSAGGKPDTPVASVPPPWWARLLPWRWF